MRLTDHHLLQGDRLEDSDPRVALCGVDKIEVRKLMGNTGFDCIVDAGLGWRASDNDAYQRLEVGVERCGTAEVAGASVAAPYVSAVAAVVAVSCLIAVA